MYTPPNVTVIPAKRPIQPLPEGGERIKVAAYCRVSTDEENQLNSYATQISYYTEYITANPHWRLIGIFADEGITGTQTTNRKQFQKMISYARKGKIDLILCKSISRFARNTVDCLDYVRELKALGVTVIFEKENINTGSMTSEFAISLYASFAQAESESISRNVTWGIEKAYREGIVHYQFHQMLGYRSGEDGKPSIVEEEAGIIRFIFKEYAAGRRSGKIADALTEMGAKRRNGSTHWTRHHVYQILKNEKYAGDAVLQKTYTENCITHDRRRNRGQRPMYLVRDCHEPIIDRKTYDTVRLEMEKRRRRKKAGAVETAGRDTKYCLSRILVCPHCGGLYKRVIWREKEGKIGVWRCKNRLEGKKCPKSPSLHEASLQKAVITAVNSIIGRMEDLDKRMEKSCQELTVTSAENERQIKELHRQLSRIEQERDEILGAVSGSLFESMNDRLRELNQQESTCANRLEVLRHRQDEHRRELLREEAAGKLLKGLRPLTSFDDDFIGTIISKIEAVSKKEVRITFYGGYTITQEVSRS